MAKAKPIFIPGTSQTFESTAAAARALGINAGNITQVLKGKRKTAGGYSFGYTSNRTIYIPETEKSYGSILAAAIAVRVSPKKVEHIIENNVGKTVGGYHFEYVDASKPIPVSATKKSRKAKKSETKKGRKSKKQERQKKKRQERQEKFERQQKRAAERKLERIASSERKARKDKIFADRFEPEFLLSNEVKELRALLERINVQLQKYQDANMMGYSRIAQDIEEFQNYLGFTDDGMFDTSVENMLNLMDEMSAEEISHWTTQLNSETDKKDGLFWDLKKQIQERAEYAIEFDVSPEELDAYADLIPELWEIFEQARHYSIYEKVGQYMWGEIKKSVIGGISTKELKKVMDNLKKWNGEKSKELQKILGDLEVAPNLKSVFDDDNLPF